MNFTIWSRAINRRYGIHLHTTKQYFLHNSKIHSFHAALFSFYTFFISHFSCIPLFSHIALFHAAIFHVTLFLVALLSSSTLLMLHFFHAVLFSCCTFQKHQEINLRLLHIRSLIETLSDISSFLTRYDKYRLLRVPLLKEYWTRRGEFSKIIPL